MATKNNSNNDNDNFSNLFYSKNNLDNTFKQVSDEIMKRTSKDISQNSTYRITFDKMSTIVYEKCPEFEKNLTTVNTQLIDKSIAYFHTKIFDKTINKSTEKQIQSKIRENILAGPQVASSNTETKYGFTMLKENEDIDNKYTEIMAQRGGDGNPNSYLPKNMNPASSYVKNEIFAKGAKNNDIYEKQFKRFSDDKKSQPDKDFTINPFNLSDDMTDALFGSENVDNPLYQNIENLQKMEGTNPMTLLEDYQKQRNQQIQIQTKIKGQGQGQGQGQVPQGQVISQARGQNQSQEEEYENTNSQSNILQTIVNPLDLSNLGNELTQKFVEKIEKNIVNDNRAQSTSDMTLAKMQEDLIKLQRDTQPKYIEKVHYININSVDREWEKNAESRFQFQVKFNQNNTFTGAGISQLYKNVVSVELVSAILPMDSSIIPFDTRLYNGLMKYPYLLLRIDELDSVFRGTNNWVDRAFSTLLFDKVFFSSVLSTDYISGTTASASIVNSNPRQGFVSEYNRGFMKYNPAYFEKKKFYNNPLASLNRMSISITDPRGNFINTQSDVLITSNISYTSNLSTLATSLEISASSAYPYSTQSDFKMIEITTTTFFSNRLYRIGDRIVMRNYSSNVALGGNNTIFNTFINRVEGHTIINLELETNGNDNTKNRGFINKLYISPPGKLDNLNETVDPTTYYDNTTLHLSGAVQGTLINIDLQTHLLFRIVTRDPDTSNTLQPINIY